MAEKGGAMIDRPMLAEILPPRILPRVLGTFDLVTIYFALIFGSYGAAQMASGGWGTIPMFFLAVLTFLVPCAMCSFELGTLYPGEGGIYIWAHKTFGPIHGFIAGWLSWVPIFLLLPLGTTTIVAHLQYAMGQTWPLWSQILVQIALILAITGVSALRLVFSQSYVRWMFFLAFGSAVIVFLVGATHHGPHTVLGSEILSFNLARHGNLFSIAILWLLGVEVPFNMGAEFSNHKRTAGKMYIWGSFALIVAYLLGIVGVLLTTPSDQVDATAGVAKAAGTFSPLLGSLVALIIVFAVASQDVAYMNSYSRLLFVSGIEHRVPSLFGQVTRRSRVPVPALVLQALGASLVVLTLASQSALAVAFNIYIAALITVWCASLFYIYLGVPRARRLHQNLYAERGPLVWKIPGGTIGLWSTVLLGVVFNVLAIYYVFAIPLTSDISFGAWLGWLVGLSVAVAVGGVIIFLRGERTAAQITAEAALARFASFEDLNREE